MRFDESSLKSNANQAKLMAQTREPGEPLFACFAKISLRALR
jgi:hypothetical protein